MRIGLTGGIASGKTTVSEWLAELGAVVIDADVLARDVVAPGTPGLAAVVETFGSDVLTPDGCLDRAALGRIVFSDTDARGRLEAIVHPLVRVRAAEIAEAAPPGAVVVQAIPLLVETRQQDDFDLVVVIDVDEAVQLARLRDERHLGAAEASARIAAQATRAERLATADRVIVNNGSLEDLLAEVDTLWADLSR